MAWNNRKQPKTYRCRGFCPILPSLEPNNLRRLKDRNTVLSCFFSYEHLLHSCTRYPVETRKSFVGAVFVPVTSPSGHAPVRINIAILLRSVLCCWLATSSSRISLLVGYVSRFWLLTLMFRAPDALTHPIGSVTRFGGWCL